MARWITEHFEEIRKYIISVSGEQDVEYREIIQEVIPLRDTSERRIRYSRSKPPHYITEEDVEDIAIPKVMLRNLLRLFKEAPDTFSTALMTHIKARGYSNAEVYTRVGIDRRLFSKIKNTHDYQPKKETAVALAMGLKLNLQETEELLAKAGYTLSDTNRRDIIIKYFFEHQIYDFDDLNYTLDQFNLPTL